MRRFFLLLTPAASALTLACSDNAGVTDPAAAVAPSFGAAVDRFEAPWPEIFVDPQSGLTLLAGATIDPQQLFDIICVGRDFTEVADWLAVTHPTSGGASVTPTPRRNVRLGNDILVINMVASSFLALGRPEGRPYARFLDVRFLPGGGTDRWILDVLCALGPLLERRAVHDPQHDG